MTAILSLISAMIIGASDFGGGVASRRASPFAVAAWVQAASLGLLFVAVWFIDAPDIRTTDLTAGVVAGLSATFSYVALYAAFSRGKISLLAPVTATVGAVIPTLVGVGRGEALAAVNVVGIVFALAAIAFVTQDREGEGEATPPIAFGLALIAGVGFSVFFLALAETQNGAGLWPLVAARVVSVPLVIVIALMVGGVTTLSNNTRLIVIAAGIAEGVSSVCALWAYQRGPLAVAAVLGAFYPVSTVLLARLLLDERLRRVQLYGVILALVAIPLVAIP
ncbi:MAG: DMT family transporter [Acidimicrobiaceae bacterium]|nr:DMT family transporter [Acidimicrobiaceae bacterium]NCG37424.1 EamA family transporter [Actinomycetota bacterium]